jgi:hypothetical protein
MMPDERVALLSNPPSKMPTVLRHKLLTLPDEHIGTQRIFSLSEILVDLVNIFVE